MEENTQKELTYQQDADAKIAAMGVSFKAEYLRNGKHFDDDKDPRDIYKITFARIDSPSCVLTLQFGQSLHHSRPSPKELEHIKRIGRSEGVYSERKALAKRMKQVEAPCAYDVLACITKYEPGTFDEFYNEFGYDTDSIKANKIYLAVVDEWFKVNRFFSDDELEIIREIQ